MGEVVQKGSAATGKAPAPIWVSAVMARAVRECAGADVEAHRAARPVLVMNYKGGVGKTLVAAQIIRAFLMAGWKVLAVDADPPSAAAKATGQRKLRDFFDDVPAGERMVAEVSLEALPAGAGRDEALAALVESILTWPDRVPVVDSPAILGKELVRGLMIAQPWRQARAWKERGGAGETGAFRPPVWVVPISYDDLQSAQLGADAIEDIARLRARIIRDTGSAQGFEVVVVLNRAVAGPLSAIDNYRDLRTRPEGKRFFALVDRYAADRVAGEGEEVPAAGLGWIRLAALPLMEDGLSVACRLRAIDPVRALHLGPDGLDRRLDGEVSPGLVDIYYPEVHRAGMRALRALAEVGVLPIAKAAVERFEALGEGVAGLAVARLPAAGGALTFED